MDASPATLYHEPLACSSAVRMAAAYGGVPLNVVHVNLATHKMDDGAPFKAINPLGQVSTLITPYGEKITETIAVLLWVQSQSERDDFVVQHNDSQYFQLIRWLSFTATEFHKQIYRMVFYDELDDASKDKIRDLASSRFAMLDEHLTHHSYLLGEHFCSADAYLGWALLLADRAGLHPERYEHLSAYAKRVRELPEIREVIADDWKHKQG